MKNTEEDMTAGHYDDKFAHLEKEIKHINETCCSPNNMEQRVKTNLLLEQLLEQMGSLKKDMRSEKDEMMKMFNELEGEQEKYRRYINYAVGGISILYFFGFMDKLKLIFASL